MRVVLPVLAVLALAGPAQAGLGVVSIPPSRDLGLPFLCDWGYDWQERCFRDDSDRLPVGGVEDKAWRAGLQFPLDGVPAGAEVVTAELWLWYDGTCLAPRTVLRPCGSLQYTLDVRPLLTPRWPVERSIPLGPVVNSGSTDPARTGWLAWDVSDLVWQWATGELRNDGLLLKLAEDEEALGSSGPAFPSSSYVKTEVRPRLIVWYIR